MEIALVCNESVRKFTEFVTKDIGALSVNVKPFLLVSLSGLALQGIDATQLIPPGITQIGQVGFVGALIWALRILWTSARQDRKDYQSVLERKDETILSMIRTTTEALAASAASNTELRNTLRDHLDTIGKQQATIERLRPAA